MKKKKILTIILTLVLTINTSLCLLNVSINNLVNDKYISDKVYEIDFVDTINNSNDKNIKKVRKNLDILYAITDIINIDNEKIDSIINSKITRDTVITVVHNIYDSIKYDKEEDLITVKDYRTIVDNNIDYINNNLKLNLDIPKKLILKEALYKVGDKVIKDVPTTGSITNEMNRTSYNLLHILLSSNTVIVCIILELVVVGILYLINKDIILSIRPVFNSIVITYFVLILLTGYLMYANNQLDIVTTIMHDYSTQVGKVCHILFYISLGYVLIRRRNIFKKKKSK